MCSFRSQRTTRRAESVEGRGRRRGSGRRPDVAVGIPAHSRRSRDYFPPTPPTTAIVWRNANPIHSGQRTISKYNEHLGARAVRLCNCVRKGNVARTMGMCTLCCARGRASVLALRAFNGSLHPKVFTQTSGAMLFWSRTQTYNARQPFIRLFSARSGVTVCAG